MSFDNVCKFMIFSAKQILREIGFCSSVTLKTFASNLEGSSAGLADIVLGVPDVAEEGAVLRRVLGLGVVEVGSGLAWFPRLVFSLLLSFVRLTRHLFFRVGVTGELSGTFSA